MQAYLFSNYAEADSLACHMKAVLGKLTTQTDVLGTQLILRSSLRCLDTWIAGLDGPRGFLNIDTKLILLL